MFQYAKEHLTKKIKKEKSEQEKEIPSFENFLDESVGYENIHLEAPAEKTIKKIL